MKLKVWFYRWNSNISIWYFVSLPNMHRFGWKTVRWSVMEKHRAGACKQDEDSRRRQKGSWSCYNAPMSRYLFIYYFITRIGIPSNNKKGNFITCITKILICIRAKTCQVIPRRHYISKKCKSPDRGNNECTLLYKMRKKKWVSAER